MTKEEGYLCWERGRWWRGSSARFCVGADVDCLRGHLCR